MDKNLATLIMFIRELFLNAFKNRSVSTSYVLK